MILSDGIRLFGLETHEMREVEGVGDGIRISGLETHEMREVEGVGDGIRISILHPWPKDSPPLSVYAMQFQHCLPTMY